MFIFPIKERILCFLALVEFSCMVCMTLERFLKNIVVPFFYLINAFKKGIKNELRSLKFK